MKKPLYITTICLIAGLFSLTSCQQSDIASISETNTKNSQRVAAIGAWSRQFTDDFLIGSTLTQWQKANRKDYNSNYCQYDPSVPIVDNKDSRTCLIITATKTGIDAYKSGLIKSNYSFKPARNEEYRISSQIKLLALDGTTFKSFTQTYGAWPAFWSVQETSWPTKGEIDIMEGYSYNGIAPARFASNLFYGTTAGNNLLGISAERNYPSTFNIDGNSGWHLYDCYWKNQNGVVTVTIMIDNQTVATYTDSINTKLKLANFGPHNVILNLNVGSNNSSFINPSLINLLSSTMMWVDYVTVDKRTI
jgi:Glycosyl hydrolases family 16